MKAPVGLLSHKAVLRKQDGVACHDKLGDHLTQLRSSAMADPVFAEALAEASAFLVQRG